MRLLHRIAAALGLYAQITVEVANYNPHAIIIWRPGRDFSRLPNRYSITQRPVEALSGQALNFDPKDEEAPGELVEMERFYNSREQRRKSKHKKQQKLHMMRIEKKKNRLQNRQRRPASHPSSSDSAHYTAESFRQIVKVTLATREIAKNLPVEYLLVLNALAESRQHSKALFGNIFLLHIFQNLQSVKKTHQYWSLLVDQVFKELLQKNRQQAHDLVKQVIVANHPFAFELLYSKLDFDALLDQPFQNLTSLVEPNIHTAFNRKIRKAFSSTVQSSQNSHLEFTSLVQRYALVKSRTEPELSYACAFLTKVPFARIKELARPLVAENYDFYLNMALFARTAYNQIDRSSAQKLLGRVLPCAYDQRRAKNYSQVIDAYVKSGLNPTDPRVLRKHISEALKNPYLTKLFPPSHISTLQALGKNSTPSRAFFDFLCYQYMPSQNFNFTREDYFFWIFLVDDALFQFALHDRHKAETFIRQVIISKDPFLSQAEDYRFDIDEFITGQHPNLGALLEFKIIEIFNEKLTEIFDGTQSHSTYKAKAELSRLLQKHTCSRSWASNCLKYHSAFLMNVPFKSVSTLAKNFIDADYNFYEEMHQFAAYVYYTMCLESTSQAQQAHKALAKISPFVYYNELPVNSSYSDIIWAYLKHEVELVDPIF